MYRYVDRCRCLEIFVIRSSLSASIGGVRGIPMAGWTDGLEAQVEILPVICDRMQGRIESRAAA